MSVEYIKEFLTNMATQDNRSTASPFYYVIRTKVSDPAPLENCDERRWYWQDDTYKSLDEIESHCKEAGYSEDEIRSAKHEAEEFGIRSRWDERGMFLTETDAEDHLKTNHYHYSPDAHTYVKHAWRAPELTKFIRSLMEHFEVKRDSKEDEG